MKTWLLVGSLVLLLGVGTAGPACGFQQTTSPAQRPAALMQSLKRAFQLIDDGKLKEAREELERSQTLAAGPCGECLLGMAHIYAAEKNWKKAKEATRQSLPLLKTPGLQARAYNQLGMAALESRDKDEAEDAFRHAVSSGGAWGTLARYNLAELLLTRGRWAEAVESARTYLKDAGPKGRFLDTVLDQDRIVLCRARAHLPEEPSLPPKPSSDLPDGIQKVRDRVTRPEIIFQVPPGYPHEARWDQAQGQVTVEAIIDEEGCVSHVRLLKGVPKGMSLVESALNSVREWVFRPATFEGRPVKVFYVLNVNFRTNSTPSGVRR
jgi:TonB family protein